MIPKRIRTYLNDRCLNDDIIAVKGIDWDARTNRIVIPIRDKNKKFLFNKYRRDPLAAPEVSKYTYDTGSKISLYNIDTVSVGDRVIITEGEFDCLVLEAHGFKSVSSTGGAGSFQKEWAKDLSLNETYICYDADTAGAHGVIKTHVDLPGSRMIWLPIIPGTKDVTDFFMNEDNPVQQFRELMMKAHSLNFPIEPEEIPETKIVLKRLKSAFDFIADKYVYIDRELANKGKSTLYTSEVLRYCNERSDYYDHLLKYKNNPERHFDEDALAEAKRYPMQSILKVNAQGFARCIWHDENTPSMKYYPKTNTVYCFGCSRAGDVLDVYMAKRGVTLSEAIKALTKHG